MAVAKGALLGPYEIHTRIGAGGMGEVWRARDKRIGRDVAVKVLPEEFAEGEQQILRFEQEARAAGALNHPGLVTIYDVGTTAGCPYIVMELLEGETLRDQLDVLSGPMRVRKVAEYGMQIAAALAVAHEKGIIHRDLKPENIFITSDRRVKILDFGLAKLAQDAKDADGRTRTARHLTSVGIVVGTPAYMSPEQVTAKPLDARTDIFSLGSVLYEMLAGRPAFDGMSAIETMHSVLNGEPPPLSSIVPDIPPLLDAIVRHCLEKDPRDRFQSARDLAFQLRMLPEMQSTLTGNRAMPAMPGRKRYGVAAMIGAAVLLLAAGGFAYFRVRGGDTSSSGLRTFRQLTFGDALETFPALAPDGQSFAYVASDAGNRDIYIQRVDGRSSINITADSPDDDSEPAFSPDGSRIAFRSERGGGGIFVMGATGESVRRLTEFGHNPAWSPDGSRLVFSTAGIDSRPHMRPQNGELWTVDVMTEATKPLIQPKVGGGDFGRDSDAVQPSWSPNGRRIAFWGLSNWFGQRDLWTLDPNAADPKKSVVRVTSDEALQWNPVWSPDGRYLYYGSNADGTLNLWRIPMDEASGAPTGPAEPASVPAPVSGNFTISRQGDIAYAAVARATKILAVDFDPQTARTGPPRTLFGSSQELLHFAPSPDGKLIAFTTVGPQEDLFVANADGSRIRQLTNDEARDRDPRWSRDGNSIYFYSNRGAAYHAWVIRTDGSGLAALTNDADLKRAGARNIFTPAPSPDGRTLVVQTDRSDALVHLDRPPGQRFEPIDNEFEVPQWSPDGTRILGAIVKHTTAGIHQRSHNDPARGIGVYSLQTKSVRKVVENGISAQWLPDGRRIIYFTKDEIHIVDVDTGATVSAPFSRIEGVTPHEPAMWPRLSADGRTLYLGQTIERGDIWLAHVENR